MAEEKSAAGTPKAQDIVKAAYSMIVERGFCNTTTKMIAERAGTSKSMIHYYFKDKDMLIVEVVRSILRRFLEIVKEVMERYPASRERIDEGITDFWEGFKAENDIMIALFESAINGRRAPEIRESLSEFYHQLLEQLVEALFSGADAPKEISAEDAEAIAAILVGGIESAALHYLLDPHSTDFERTIDMLKRAVKALMSWAVT